MKEKWTKIAETQCDLTTLTKDQRVAYGDGKTYYYLIEPQQEDMNNEMCPRCEKPHDINLTHTCVSVSSTGILSQQKVQDRIVCRHCHRKTGNGIKGNCTCTERQADGTWVQDEGKCNCPDKNGYFDNTCQNHKSITSTVGWEEELNLWQKNKPWLNYPIGEKDLKAFISKTRQDAYQEGREDETIDAIGTMKSAVKAAMAQAREEVLKELVDRLSEAFALEIENRDGTKDRFCSEAKIIQIIQEDK